MLAHNSSQNQFHSLYESSFKGVFRFFYYKSVRFENIEELCQEVYLRFWQNYQGKLDDFEQCKKILYGIALNVYREWVHRQVRQGFVQLENYWDELLEADSLNSTAHWETANYDNNLEQLKIELRRAMEQLPPRLQEVVRLRCLEGLSRQATADKMNLTADQVHIYQKRAVKSLKEIIQGKQLSQCTPSNIPLSSYEIL